MLLPSQFAVVIEAAYFVERALYLYRVIFNLRQKVNIPIKYRFLSKTNQNNAFSDHFREKYFRVIDKSGN